MMNNEVGIIQFFLNIIFDTSFRAYLKVGLQRMKI